MRNLHLLNLYRDTSPEVVNFYGDAGDESCGAFKVKSPIDNALMRVIASAYEGWDHVSVSRENRCPNWIEMSLIKDLFFKDTETVMQLHVPRKDHISFHPNCLHMWRPHNVEIPRPPASMVAPVRKHEEASTA